jgi:hypothetical protein
VTSIPSGVRLRIIAADPFVLEWTSSDWSQRVRLDSAGTLVNVHYVDIPTDAVERIRFRFQSRSDENVFQEYTIQIGSH